MATVAITNVRTGLSHVINPQWIITTANDVGEKIKIPQYQDKTVHIYGDFATSGSVTMRGSNKPNPDEATAGDWFTLTDAQANAITKTAAAGEVILENPLWISPIKTAGTGAIIISLTAKKEAM